MGYEVSVTDVFDTDETWPNEKYNLDNINKQLLRGDNYFDLIIANKKHVDPARHKRTIDGRTKTDT
jgi:hypothetical protein